MESFKGTTKVSTLPVQKFYPKNKSILLLRFKHMVQSNKMFMFGLVKPHGTLKGSLFEI